MGATAGAFGVRLHGPPLVDDGPSWRGGKAGDTACACESWPLARLMAICPWSSCFGGSPGASSLLCLEGGGLVRDVFHHAI